MTQYGDMTPEEPQGWSPLAVAMIATLVLLLGLAGALFGIYVANVNAAAAANPTPSLTAVPATPTPTPGTPTPTNPTPTVTTNPPPPDTFPLPDLTGLDFRDARTEVRQLGLDWTLTFSPTGDDPTVVSTSPSAGEAVSPGTRITIVVEGRPPLTDPPDLIGLPCADGVAMIIEAGLNPSFLTPTRTGTVQFTLAPPNARWNDPMALACAG